MNIKAFENKRIYLTPSNDITHQLHDFLTTRIIFKFCGYIDSQKQGSNISSIEETNKDFDIIIIASPNYSNEIAEKLYQSGIDSNKIVFCYKLLSYTFQSSNFLNYPIRTYFNIRRILLEFFRPHKFRWWPYKIKFFLAKLGIQLTTNEQKITALKNKHKNDRAFTLSCVRIPGASG